MRIVTFTSPDAPERERWIAYFYRQLFSKGAQTGEERLPMSFAAPTKALAHAGAEAWWAAEQSKRANAAKAQAERDAARKRPTAQREIAE